MQTMTKPGVLVAGVAAGLVLGGVRYAIDRDVLGASLVGGACALILVLMLGFPGVANRSLLGGHPHHGRLPRRSALSVIALGLGLLALAAATPSASLLMLGVAYALFWAAVIYFSRRAAT